MNAALDACEITVSVGEKLLLDHVSLRVTPGETVALIGPNGAGKSTFLRVMSGELRPDHGAVLMHAREIGTFSPAALALRRAVLAQSITVNFPFTVAEIVRMGAGGRQGATIDAQIEDALATVDLDGFAGRIMLTLSGGEQQRVHCARVMVQLACGEAEHGPGVLLLDEPTSSLDLRHQIELLSTVKRLAANGTAIVAVLHDLNLAAMFAQRIVAMSEGRVAADGPAAETVNDRLLQDVFKVSIPVGRTPPPGTPFVLPHAAI
jgi:iron complex transport system ATP-binding protein